MTENADTIARTSALIKEMAMELHDRGCDENHHLIRKTGEILRLLNAMQEEAAASFDPEKSRETATPQKLHLLPAEEVSVMNLKESLDQGAISGADLAEAAFTFENELMAVLGDDNTMPADAYAGMDDKTLIKVIRSAVDNICRFRSS